jgi:hypothetical protein
MSAFRVQHLALALSLAACATGGVVRDRNMATIGAAGAVVDTIDGRNVRDETAGARFEIAPGRHTLEVSLAPEKGAAPQAEQPVLPVCFEAAAGRSYTARPVVEQERWRPEVVDEESGAVVSTRCPDPVPEVAEAPPATPPPATAAATEPAVAEATPASDRSRAAPAEPPPTPPAPTPQPAPVSLPVPRAPVGPPADAPPGIAVNLALGFFWGGDSLVDAMFVLERDRSLQAGRGLLLSAGALWTPLWATDSVGFGLGADVGWKYDVIEASNGSASLTRIPVSASAHSLIRLADRWFTLLSAGLHTELAGRLSGSGAFKGIDRDLSGGVGFLAQAGLHYHVGRVAVGGALRYSILKDQVQGTKVDANSFGILASGHYGF